MKLRQFICLGMAAVCLGVMARAQTTVPTTTYASGTSTAVVGPTTITTGGNAVVVASGAEVVFIATGSIDLKPGFQSSLGSSFDAVVIAPQFSTTLSLDTSSIVFGQTVTVTATTTDPSGNLVSQSIDYSSDGGTTWVNGANWSGDPTDSNTLTWTIPAAVLNKVGTWQIRASGFDNTNGPSSYATATITVSKATPIVSQWSSQTFANAHTVTQADLSAMFVNPYSSSATPPAGGTVTYSIVAGGSGSLHVGTVLQPGTYTIQVSYSGDGNYNSSSPTPVTWTDILAETFGYDAAGRLTSAVQTNGLNISYVPDPEANVTSVTTTTP
jgi:YD repeat-containing protein